MTLSGKIKLIIENPIIVLARLKGLKPIYASHCLTAKKLLKSEAKTIIDVGANRGDFSRACFYVFPNAKVYAFEPLPKYAKTLGSMNLSFFPVGLWNKNQESDFFFNKMADRKSSFLNYGRKNVYRKEDIEKIKIPQKRFDSLGIHVDRPCYLKIDVEGAEDKVLEGFGKKLKEIDILQVEINFQDNFKGQATFVEILKISERAGFTGFLQENVVYENESPARCDLFFFR